MGENIMAKQFISDTEMEALENKGVAKVVKPKATKPKPKKGKVFISDAEMEKMENLGTIPDEINPSPAWPVGMARAGAAGASFGLSPHVEALVRSTGSETWEEARAKIDREMDAFRKDSPVLSYGSDIAGSVATGTALRKLVPAATQLIGRTVLGGTESGLRTAADPEAGPLDIAASTAFGGGLSAMTHNMGWRSLLTTGTGAGIGAATADSGERGMGALKGGATGLAVAKLGGPVLKHFKSALKLQENAAKVAIKALGGDAADFIDYKKSLQIGDTLLRRGIVRAGSTKKKMMRELIGAERVSLHSDAAEVLDPGDYAKGGLIKRMSDQVNTMISKVDKQFKPSIAAQDIVDDADQEISKLMQSGEEYFPMARGKTIMRHIREALQRKGTISKLHPSETDAFLEEVAQLEQQHGGVFPPEIKREMADMAKVLFGGKNINSESMMAIPDKQFVDKIRGMAMVDEGLGGSFTLEGLNNFKKSLGKTLSDKNFENEAAKNPMKAQALTMLYRSLKGRIEDVAESASPGLGNRIKALNMQNKYLIDATDIVKKGLAKDVSTSVVSMPERITPFSVAAATGLLTKDPATAVAAGIGAWGVIGTFKKYGPGVVAEALTPYKIPRTLDAILGNKEYVIAKVVAGLAPEMIEPAVKELEAVLDDPDKAREMIPKFMALHPDLFITSAYGSEFEGHLSDPVDRNKFNNDIMLDRNLSTMDKTKYIDDMNRLGKLPMQSKEPGKEQNALAPLMELLGGR